MPWVHPYRWNTALRAPESGVKCVTSTPGEITRIGVPTGVLGLTTSNTVRPNAMIPLARAMVWRSIQLNGGGYCFEVFWKVAKTRGTRRGVANATWAAAAT